MELTNLDKIKIWNLKNYTETNVQRYEDIRDLGLEFTKDDISFFCKLQNNFKIRYLVYSREDTYLIRYLYIFKNKKVFPSAEQINIFLKEFGFRGKIEDETQNEDFIVTMDSRHSAYSISELF